MHSVDGPPLEVVALEIAERTADRGSDEGCAAADSGEASAGCRVAKGLDEPSRPATVMRRAGSLVSQTRAVRGDPARVRRWPTTGRPSMKVRIRTTLFAILFGFANFRRQASVTAAHWRSAAYLPGKADVSSSFGRRLVFWRRGEKRPQDCMRTLDPSCQLFFSAGSPSPCTTYPSSFRTDGVPIPTPVTSTSLAAAPFAAPPSPGAHVPVLRFAPGKRHGWHLLANKQRRLRILGSDDHSAGQLLRERDQLRLFCQWGQRQHGVPLCALG